MSSVHINNHLQTGNFFFPFDEVSVFPICSSTCVPVSEWRSASLDIGKVPNSQIAWLRSGGVRSAVAHQRPSLRSISGEKEP